MENEEVKTNVERNRFSKVIYEIRVTPFLHCNVGYTDQALDEKEGGHSPPFSLPKLSMT
ncbi:hypothetical protein [Brevibacillus parabrevis]|uniref:Uncharacterized protein n=1 Tax=Brevibacillus parabrevis TaxID=54914 RepID=A0A4Y3PAG3_BREPA|nr:hypothetical protein [Brevibacillus parabrevis]GEB31500.1 hypothetical protein BPA01_10800 [Brevibacillus parabrevis]